NPVAEEGVDLLVVVVTERERHHGRLLGETQSLRHVVVETHQAGHPVELAYRLPIHGGFPLQHRTFEGCRHPLTPLADPSTLTGRLCPRRNCRTPPVPCRS